ncbi:TetR/AcrR family transcriptional regulator [Thermodesulfobacteriota bacterium]
MTIEPKEWTEKNLKRVKKIRKTAAALFHRKGYLQTTLDDIAIGARFSKGGIYHYFGSKDEILFSILNSYMDQVLDDLVLELEKIADGEGKIRYLISRHVRVFTENMNEAKTLLHEKNCLPGKYQKSIEGRERQYYGIVRSVLESYFAGKKKIPGSYMPVMTFLLFGICNWLYAWYDPEGAVDSRELSEIIWKIFLKGVNGF